MARSVHAASPCVLHGEKPANVGSRCRACPGGARHLEHLVVQDLFLTETAKYADVVLPASALPEKAAPSPTPTARCRWAAPPLPLPGNARQDWWIIQELANRIGLAWSYTHPRDVFAEMKQAMPSLNGITLGAAAARAFGHLSLRFRERARADIVFGDGFPTKSGRGRFVPAAIVPPAEEPDADYPMVLTTGRQLEHWHTGAMTRRATVLDELEPEAVASLAPAELRRLGLHPGDRVRVTRGAARSN